MWQQQKFTILDASHVGEVRRYSQVMSHELNFDETRRGKISIAVTELATNIVKHAGEGEIIISRHENTLHVLALDKGKGMSNVSECLTDGYSSGGTSGTGLGAIKRAACHFDLFTKEGKGTAIFASFFAEKPSAKPFEIGVVSIPYKNEKVCGDAWSASTEKLRFMVCDGLGHGVFAHEASLLAQEIFQKCDFISLDQLMQNLHGGLRSTRGAAISLVELDMQKEILNYCGVGNVAGTLYTPKSVKRCISFNGTVGGQIRKIQTLPYPFDLKEGVLVMASDGISTYWSLGDYPGLYKMNPNLIAGVLYRDFGRTTDDVTVLVVKGAE